MSDPVADFLAREQDVLAGIDDAPVPEPTEGINGIAGMDNGMAAMEINDENGLNGFEHLNGGGDSGVDLSVLDANHIPAVRGSTNNTPSPLTINSMPKIEPEKIRKWREEQKIMLEQKDASEETKKDELRTAAKKELDEWYAQREAQLLNTKTANREAEKEILADRDTNEGAAEWERIAKLCEFNAKNSKNTTDMTRMRSLLLGLKVQKE